MELITSLEKGALKEVRAKFLQRHSGDRQLLTIHFDEFAHAILSHLSSKSGRNLDIIREDARSQIRVLAQYFDATDIDSRGAISWLDFTNFCLRAGRLQFKPSFKHSISVYKQQTIHGQANFPTHAMYFEPSKQVLFAFDSDTPTLRIYRRKGIYVGKVNVLMELRRILRTRTPHGPGHATHKDLDKELTRAKPFEKDVNPFKGKVLAMTYIPSVQQYVIATSACFLIYCRIAVRHEDMETVGYVHTTDPQYGMLYLKTLDLLITWPKEASDHMFRVWDPRTRRLRVKIRKHEHLILDACAVDLNENIHTARYVASCSIDKRLIIWSTAPLAAITNKLSSNHKVKHSEAREFELKGHTHAIRCVKYAPEHELLLGAGFDYTVYAWDPYTRNICMKLVGHYKGVVGMQVVNTPNEKVVSFDEDGVLRVWNIDKECGVFALQLQSVPLDCAHPIRVHQFEATFDQGNTVSILAEKIYHFKVEIEAVDNMRPVADGLGVCYTSSRAWCVSRRGINIVNLVDGTVYKRVAFLDPDRVSSVDHVLTRAEVVQATTGVQTSTGQEESARIVDAMMRGSVVDERDSITAVAVDRTRKKIFLGTSDGRVLLFDTYTFGLILQLTVNEEDEHYLEQGNVVGLKYVDRDELVVAAYASGTVKIFVGCHRTAPTEPEPENEEYEAVRKRYDAATEAEAASMVASPPASAAGAHKRSSPSSKNPWFNRSGTAATETSALTAPSTFLTETAAGGVSVVTGIGGSCGGAEGILGADGMSMDDIAALKESFPGSCGGKGPPQRPYLLRETDLGLVSDLSIYAVEVSEACNLIATPSKNGSIYIYDYLTLELVSIVAIPCHDGSPVFSVGVHFTPVAPILLAIDSVGRTTAWTVKPMKFQWISTFSVYHEVGYSISAGAAATASEQADAHAHRDNLVPLIGNGLTVLKCLCWTIPPRGNNTNTKTMNSAKDSAFMSSRKSGKSKTISFQDNAVVGTISERVPYSAVSVAHLVSQKVALPEEPKNNFSDAFAEDRPLSSGAGPSASRRAAGAAGARATVMIMQKSQKMNEMERKAAEARRLMLMNMQPRSTSYHTHSSKKRRWVIIVGDENGGIMVQDITRLIASSGANAENNLPKYHAHLPVYQKVRPTKRRAYATAAAAGNANAANAGALASADHNDDEYDGADDGAIKAEATMLGVANNPSGDSITPVAASASAAAGRRVSRAAPALNALGGNFDHNTGPQGKQGSHVGSWIACPIGSDVHIEPFLHCSNNNRRTKREVTGLRKWVAYKSDPVRAIDVLVENPLELRRVSPLEGESATNAANGGTSFKGLLGVGGLAEGGGGGGMLALPSMSASRDEFGDEVGQAAVRDHMEFQRAPEWLLSASDSGDVRLWSWEGHFLGQCRSDEVTDEDEIAEKNETGASNRGAQPAVAASAGDPDWDAQSGTSQTSAASAAWSGAQGRGKGKMSVLGAGGRHKDFEGVGTDAEESDIEDSEDDELVIQDAALLASSSEGDPDAIAKVRFIKMTNKKKGAIQRDIAKMFAEAMEDQRSNFISTVTVEVNEVGGPSSMSRASSADVGDTNDNGNGDHEENGDSVGAMAGSASGAWIRRGRDVIVDSPSAQRNSPIPTSPTAIKAAAAAAAAALVCRSSSTSPSGRRGSVVTRKVSVVRKSSVAAAAAGSPGQHVINRPMRLQPGKSMSRIDTSVGENKIPGKSKSKRRSVAAGAGDEVSGSSGNKARRQSKQGARKTSSANGPAAAGGGTGKGVRFDFANVDVTDPPLSPNADPIGGAASVGGGGGGVLSAISGTSVSVGARSASAAAASLFGQDAEDDESKLVNGGHGWKFPSKQITLYYAIGKEAHQTKVSYSSSQVDYLNQIVRWAIPRLRVLARLEVSARSIAEASSVALTVSAAPAAAGMSTSKSAKGKAKGTPAALATTDSTFHSMPGFTDEMRHNMALHGGSIEMNADGIMIDRGLQVHPSIYLSENDDNNNATAASSSFKGTQKQRQQPESVAGNTQIVTSGAQQQHPLHGGESDTRNSQQSVLESVGEMSAFKRKYETKNLIKLIDHIQRSSFFSRLKYGASTSLKCKNYEKEVNRANPLNKYKLEEIMRMQTASADSAQLPLEYSLQNTVSFLSNDKMQLEISMVESPRLFPSMQQERSEISVVGGASIFRGTLSEDVLEEKEKRIRPEPIVIAVSSTDGVDHEHRAENNHKNNNKNNNNNHRDIALTPSPPHGPEQQAASTTMVNLQKKILLNGTYDSIACASSFIDAEEAILSSMMHAVIAEGAPPELSAIVGLPSPTVGAGAATTPVSISAQFASAIRRKRSIAAEPEGGLSLKSDAQQATGTDMREDIERETVAASKSQRASNNDNSNIINNKKDGEESSAAGEPEPTPIAAPVAAKSAVTAEKNSFVANADVAVDNIIRNSGDFAPGGMSGNTPSNKSERQGREHEGRVRETRRHHQQGNNPRATSRPVNPMGFRVHSETALLASARASPALHAPSGAAATIGGPAYRKAAAAAVAGGGVAGGGGEKGSAATHGTISSANENMKKSESCVRIEHILEQLHEIADEGGSSSELFADHLSRSRSRTHSASKEDTQATSAPQRYSHGHGQGRGQGQGQRMRPQSAPAARAGGAGGGRLNVGGRNSGLVESHNQMILESRVYEDIQSGDSTGVGTVSAGRRQYPLRGGSAAAAEAWGTERRPEKAGEGPEGINAAAGEQGGYRSFDQDRKLKILLEKGKNNRPNSAGATGSARVSGFTASPNNPSTESGSAPQNNERISNSSNNNNNNSLSNSNSNKDAIGGGSATKNARSSSKCRANAKRGSVLSNNEFDGFVDMHRIEVEAETKRMARESAAATDCVSTSYYGPYSIIDVISFYNFVGQLHDIAGALAGGVDIPQIVRSAAPSSASKANKLPPPTQSLQMRKLSSGISTAEALQWKDLKNYNAKFGNLSSPPSKMIQTIIQSSPEQQQQNQHQNQNPVAKRTPSPARVVADAPRRPMSAPSTAPSASTHAHAHGHTHAHASLPPITVHRIYSLEEIANHEEIIVHDSLVTAITLYSTSHANTLIIDERSLLELFFPFASPRDIQKMVAFLRAAEIFCFVFRSALPPKGQKPTTRPTSLAVDTVAAVGTSTSAAMNRGPSVAAAAAAIRSVDAGAGEGKGGFSHEADSNPRGSALKASGTTAAAVALAGGEKGGEGGRLTSSDSPLSHGLSSPTRRRYSLLHGSASATSTTRTAGRGGSGGGEGDGYTRLHLPLGQIYVIKLHPIKGFRNWQIKKRVFAHLQHFLDHWIDKEECSIVVMEFIEIMRGLVPQKQKDKVKILRQLGVLINRMDAKMMDAVTGEFIEQVFEHILEMVIVP